MKGMQTRCNTCGRVKQETNHWFVTVVDPNCPEGIAFGVSGALPESGDGLIVEDQCGHACLHKRLSQWLESQTSTAAAPAESVTQ